MIRGNFTLSGASRRPYSDAYLEIPSVNILRFDVKFLVDTGADRTILGPADARRLARRFGIDLSALPQGGPSQGIGGRATTRIADATVNLDSSSISLPLAILEPPPGALPSIPSLLGRNALAHFALFMEERTNRVLLLTPEEAEALNLP